MEYYYDSDNDFYVIILNNIINQKEYLKILKEIIQNDSRGDLNVYYTTFTNNFEYVILDFNKRKLSNEEIINLLNKKKRGK